MKKNLLKLLATVSVAGLLVGCGSSSSSNGDNNTTESLPVCSNSLTKAVDFNSTDSALELLALESGIDSSKVTIVSGGDLNTSVVGEHNVTFTASELCTGTGLLTVTVKEYEAPTTTTPVVNKDEAYIKANILP